MCAYFSNDSKSAPSSKWCRKAFWNLSEYTPLQYRDVNILQAAEALLGSPTRFNKSSTLHPHAAIDSLGSCLAHKNCSSVTSVGNVSQKLTSNLFRICLTVTSDPMANNTSVALPHKECLILVTTIHKPNLHPVTTNLDEVNIARYFFVMNSSRDNAIEMLTYWDLQIWKWNFQHGLIKHCKYFLSVVVTDRLGIFVSHFLTMWRKNYLNFPAVQDLLSVSPTSHPKFWFHN